MWANAAGCSSSPWTSENVERVWKLVFANRLLGEKNYGWGPKCGWKNCEEDWLKIWAWRKFQPRSCHQLCLMSGTRYSLVLVLISVVSWPRETSFGIDLLWMMNFDALNVIQKWNAKAYSGKHKHYLKYLATLVSASVVVTIQLFFTLSFLKSEEFQHC